MKAQEIIASTAEAPEPRDGFMIVEIDTTQYGYNAAFAVEIPDCIRLEIERQLVESGRFDYDSIGVLRYNGVPFNTLESVVKKITTGNAPINNNQTNEVSK